ncbi:thioredoxin-disulfide reductase [Natranaerobius thermophilus]|uniref:Thioredoxin reductase n=1 Tax=Natranaerobius thermophilus (strain ATCC BAA-1301 / DSM 18059 / JW/NM-WN-LF) TaxID=457570 RepID=B2A5X3_NATTJ|nr:thioredoxin-disulfide reductase [Natranaerobius thermophilus]ACB84066.1 thioredoxin reductase [Natranaerobius thermophilus JW/NM-WN-LF]
MSDVFDVLIIGGGPAGLTAGIYASRSKLKTAILEKKRKPGGQMSTTWELENYPGFKEATGPDIAKSLSEHAEKFGCEFLKGEVKEIDLHSNPKVVTSKKGEEYHAKSVIMATGAEPRTLGLPGEHEFRGLGVGYCATCDADFYTDQEVIVIGSGDAAVEEAIYLTRFAKKVTIVVVHEEGKMDATKVIQERAFENPKIDYIWNSVVEEIKGDELVDRVVVKNIKTGETSEVKTDGVFIFVGTIPKTEFIEGQVELTEQGYVKVNDQMETSVPGVYSAGDVNDKFLRQVVTACADGAIAATACERFLEERQDIEEKIEEPSQEKSVIVVFWSPTVKESMEAISQLEEVVGNDNQVKIVNIDTYKSTGIADNYQINEIPSIIAVRNKKVVASLTGKEVNKEKLADFYQDLV